MKVITKYQAKDGSEWTTVEACEARDQLIDQVDAVMAPLGDTPQGVKDGKGWLQHDNEKVKLAKDGILDICRERGYGEHYPVFKEQGRNCHPLSFIGRCLDDVGGPLGVAWNRFCRIDPSGREHEQCYYAYTAGPDPKHVCVEDRSKE